MSLISYVLGSGFTVVSADTRVGTCLQYSIQSQCNAIIWFENHHKLYLFSPPHNYVATAYHGTMPLKITSYFKEFEKTLPAERLTIEDYARKASEFFYEKFQDDYQFYSSEKKSWFNVVGYNPETNDRAFFSFNLPFQPQPEEIDRGVIAFIETGFTKFTEGYKEIFQNTYMENFTKKLVSKKKLGFPLSKTENQRLNDYLANKSITRIMNQAECIKFSQGLIEDTSAKLFESEEFESVGKSMDMIVISPDRGIEVVANEYSEEILAESARHMILIECCQSVTKIQIDFIETNLLKNGFIKYPEGDKFRCSNCKSEYDLSILYIQIEEYAAKKIVL